MAVISSMLVAFINGDTDFDVSQLSNNEINWIIESGLASLAIFVGRKSLDKLGSEQSLKLISSDSTLHVLTSNQLDELISVFKNYCVASSPIVALKGCAIALLYYRQPRLRTMGDLDLLVTNEYHKTIETNLIDNGFVKKSKHPESYYEDFHHSMPLYSAEKRIWIELHTKIIPPSDPAEEDKCFSSDVLWGNIVEHRYDNVNFFAFNQELMLLHTCVHCVTDPAWDRFLIKLLDAALIIESVNFPLSWEKVLQLSNASPCATSALNFVITILVKLKLVEIHRNVLLKVHRSDKILNTFNMLILQSIATRYAINGKRFDRIRTVTNVKNLWTTLLLNNKNPWLNLFIYVPINLLFPSEQKNRFSVIGFFSRLKNALFGR